MWRLYHLIVADAIAVQRPTKYRLVREFLGPSLGIAADIGCGPGVFTSYMSVRAALVVALDIDCASLERAKSRHRKRRNAHFAATTAISLPFSDNAFETILFLEVLEHIEDDRAALHEIWRVLRPEGKLVVSVPVPPGEVNDELEWGHKREGYELPVIVDLLANSGFEVQRHAFAEFRFSRVATKLIRLWKQATRLPPPIFLSWLAYLDCFYDSRQTANGNHSPACVVISARKVLNGCG